MKLLKRLLLGLTILATLLIGGVFLAVNLIDPNDYKDKIQSLTMEKTGRPLSIDGDISLSYFPWAGFTLGSIAMANPPGFGDTPFVEIDSAQIKVKLLPLLKKTITVDTVELAGLNLDLQRKADGSTNWDDLSSDNNVDADSEQNTTDGETIESTEPGNPTEGTDTQPLKDLSIGSIVIKNAQVKWQDQLNSTDLRLTGFNLVSDTIELAKPFSLNTDFALNSDSIGVQAEITGVGEIALDLDNQLYQINQLTLTGNAAGEAIPIDNFDIEIRGDVITDLTAQTASLTSMTVDSLGVVLSGDVQISDLAANPTVNSNLKSNTFSPRDIARKLNIELPETQDSEVLKAATLAMNLSGSTQSATLNDLSITLDDTTLNGNLNLPDLTRSIPPVKFNLALDTIDLDRYLAPVTAVPGTAVPGTAAPETTGEETTQGTAEDVASSTGDTPIELPVELLRQLHIDGIFKIDNLKASNLTSSNIQVPVKASNGKINISDFTASLYAGKLSSTVAVDVTGETPRYQVSTNADKVQVEPLFQDLLQDTAPISGQAIISSELSTTGNTVNGLISNLKGQYVSDFTDGAIIGINIGYQLRRARSLFSNAREETEEPVSRTDFSELHVSANIDQGVIQSDDLDIRAPALRIAGAGTVNLPQQSVDYTINPKVVGSVQGQGGKDLNDLKGVALRIPIRGSFDELSKDFSGTIFSAMKEDFSNQAETAAKALAKEQRDKLKAEAKEKADAAKREAQEKLRTEQARAEEKVQEQLTAQQEKVEQAADELKDKAKDKLKSLFK